MRIAQSPSRAAPDFGYMNNVYTVPQVRNLGVGTKLLAEVKCVGVD